MLRPALIAAVLALTACGSSRPRAVSQRHPSRLHALMTATGVENPVQAALRAPFTFVQIAGVRLDLNPNVHDPISALGACADVVTRCYQPPMRSLDVCVDFVRVCATDTPWNEPPCCPVSCRTGYHAARVRGDAPLDAFEHVYLAAPTCVAGVGAMTASQP